MTMFLTSMLLFAFSAAALADDQYFAYGSGTADDPFLLSTPDDLMSMAAALDPSKDSYLTPELREEFMSYAAAYYKLTDNINMSGYGWQPLMTPGNKPFSGDFNGNNKVISNLTNIPDNAGYNVGFFGIVSGKVYDLTLENLNFFGTSF